MAILIFVLTLAVSAHAEDMSRRGFLSWVGRQACVAAVAQVQGSLLGQLLLPESSPALSSMNPVERERLIAAVNWLKESFGKANFDAYVNVLRQAVKLHKTRGIPILALLEGFTKNLRTVLFVNGSSSVGALNAPTLTALRNVLESRMPGLTELLGLGGTTAAANTLPRISLPPVITREKPPEPKENTPPPPPIEGEPPPADPSQQ